MRYPQRFLFTLPGRRQALRYERCPWFPRSRTFPILPGFEYERGRKRRYLGENPIIRRGNGSEDSLRQRLHGPASRSAPTLRGCSLSDCQSYGFLSANLQSLRHDVHRWSRFDASGVRDPRRWMDPWGFRLQERPVSIWRGRWEGCSIGGGTNAGRTHCFFHHYSFTNRSCFSSTSLVSPPEAYHHSTPAPTDLC